MNRSPELQAALDAAAKAGEIIGSTYRRNIEVRVKADKSPVTDADVSCEDAIRNILETRFPSYGFFGEETLSRGLDAENLWLVDPIDGTKAFVREYPMFSTQIALLRRGEIVLGVSSAPVYGELAFAERGCGAFLNGSPLRVSEIDDLSDAALSSRVWRPVRDGKTTARWLRASIASEVMAIFCITICWLPARSMQSLSRTSIFSISRPASRS
jgi:histidinol-phosphatase